MQIDIYVNLVWEIVMTWLSFETAVVTAVGVMKFDFLLVQNLWASQVPCICNVW